jgi:hypothetical protein
MKELLQEAGTVCFRSIVPTVFPHEFVAKNKTTTSSLWRINPLKLKLL